jgi:membrane protein
MAAGVSYYGILSVFPLILGLLAILGFFLPSETVQQVLFDLFRDIFPLEALLV